MSHTEDWEASSRLLVVSTRSAREGDDYQVDSTYHRYVPPPPMLPKLLSNLPSSFRDLPWAFRLRRSRCGCGSRVSCPRGPSFIKRSGGASGSKRVPLRPVTFGAPLAGRDGRHRAGTTRPGESVVLPVLDGASSVTGVCALYAVHTTGWPSTAPCLFRTPSPR